MGPDQKTPKGISALREPAEAGLKSKVPEIQKLPSEKIDPLVHALERHQLELERQNETLRQTQVALKEACEKYRDFYDFAPVGFLTLDESGMTREANLTAVSQLGVTRSHLIDKPFRFFIEADDRDRFHRYLKQIFATPGPQHCEIRLTRKDGGVLFARLDSVAITDASGARLCRASLTDISGLKQTGQRLQASERRFAAFMEHLPSLAVIRDLEGRYLFVNEAVLQAFHNTREDWLGKTVEDLWPPEVVEKFKALDRLILKTGRPVRALDTLRHPDGLHHYIYYTFPIADQEGKPVMIGINAVDVTDHLETKARLEHLLASGPAAIYTVAAEGDFAPTYISDNVKGLVGWEPRHFLENPRFWIKHVHPEDRRQVLKRLELPWPEDHQTFDYRFLAKDGVYRWMHDAVKLVRDPDGKPVEIAGAWMDITARKETEAIIHKERQRFFSLLDMLPASVCLVAPDLTLPFVNRQFREIFEDPQGRTCHELIHGRPTPCDECNIREILETQQPSDWERTTPQGRTYQIYNYPFADIDGSPMVLKLGMDITARKGLEAQLLQAQKMEAVGRLAGGVAHDFNNLLMTIMGYGELIRTSLVQDDPLHRYSEDILKATERAASLTQQLLAFSRQQVVQPQVLNLNRVAADLEKMLRRLIGEHIDLSIVAGPDLGTVRADPGQLNQIIMNLALNARDAMPKGGRLTLETANVDFAASHSCRFYSVPPGRYVMLSVSDTGFGMDPETVNHIFEPFFTTKEMGKGTGLGLSMVYGIVKQNQGCIDVVSRTGEGATFKIYLPRLEAAEEAPGARVSPAAKLEGSETILVVEDEDGLRTLLCRFFRLFGYNVLEARHGGEALLLCERHQGPIHLMVTDVVMPQMSGKELADRLAPLRPEMAVFFMSGYTDSDLSDYGAPDSSQHFIPKPFRPMDLVKRVRDFLDASRGLPADDPRG
jgi:two-component system cell cycle sensor histidine kinase/response regulator CckA